MIMSDFKGNEIWSNSREILVQPNSSQEVFSIPNVDIYRTNYVYITEFNNKKSLYYFESPKNLNLPKGEITKEITKTTTGFSITLKSAVLQKHEFLSTKQRGHFSENFFDLLPYESITIEFKSEGTSLDDLQIKSLNNIKY